MKTSGAHRNLSIVLQERDQSCHLGLVFFRLLEVNLLRLEDLRIEDLFLGVPWQTPLSGVLEQSDFFFNRFHARAQMTLPAVLVASQERCFVDLRHEFNILCQMCFLGFVTSGFELAFEQRDSPILNEWQDFARRNLYAWPMTIHEPDGF